MFSIISATLSLPQYVAANICASIADLNAYYEIVDVLTQLPTLLAQWPKEATKQLPKSNFMSAKLAALE